MGKQIAKVTLYERVYEHLRDGILSNEYLPGEVLSIESLAQETGVSTTPIREALSRLVAEGLVEQAPNKSVRVAGITPDDVTEVYEVRLLFEPYVASLAANWVTGNSRLKRELLSIEKAAEQVSSWPKKAHCTPAQRKTYLQIDLRLGALLWMVTANSLLKRIMATVSSHSRRIRSYAEASLHDDFALVQKVNSEHLSIISAIKEGRSKDAEVLVRKHLLKAKQRTLAQLTEAKAEEAEVLKKPSSLRHTYSKLTG